MGRVMEVFLNCKASTFYELVSNEGEIIGGVHVTNFPPSWVEIQNLNVVKHHRNKGFGLVIMKAVIEDFKQSPICLYVESDGSEGSLSDSKLFSWYQRLGFEIGSPYHQELETADLPRWMHRQATPKVF